MVKAVDDSPDRWHDLGEFIRDQRHIGRLSLRKLSEMAGISNPYLSQIERGLRKPSAEILQQIATALRISAETLYVRAGILEEPDGADARPRRARSAVTRCLTEEQKQALVRIYGSFRRDENAVRAPNGSSAPAVGGRKRSRAGRWVGSPDVRTFAVLSLHTRPSPSRAPATAAA